MKYLYFFIFLFFISCKDGKLTFKDINNTCDDVDYIWSKKSIPIDIAKSSNDIELQERKTADSLANKMTVKPKEVILINTSSSKTMTFTIKITTKTIDDTTSETYLYTLFPGEQKIIGCTYFGYKILDNQDFDNTKTSPVLLGQKDYEIVAEFIKK